MQSRFTLLAPAAPPVPEEAPVPPAPALPDYKALFVAHVTKHHPVGTTCPDAVRKIAKAVFGLQIVDQRVLQETCLLRNRCEAPTAWGWTLP